MNEVLLQIAFSQRPASTQWEPLPVTRIPGLTLWAWYRPQHIPHGLTISIPPEVAAAYPTGMPFTIGDLLLAAGAAVSQFQAVSLFGAQWQPVAAFGPFLNHPVPAIMSGGRPEIGLMLMEQAPAATMAGSLAPDSDIDQTDPLSEGDADRSDDRNRMYDRIEASWKASNQMERQMQGLRQKLSGLLNSLGKLDRDLSPEERLSADREDRDAWEEARRWIRDLHGKCHREIKQFDIGMTSSAGRKNQMHQFYEQVIEPRRPCNDLELQRREFDTYRKDMTNLQRAMASAAQAASQNGTQRAQRVLASIGKKIRERRRRMREPIGGVNMDKSCRRKK